MSILDIMMFDNFLMFFNERKKLRLYYAFLTFEEKTIYKKYIYALNFKDFVKDKIWEYFNEPKASLYYVFDYEIVNYMRLYERNKNNIEI